MPCWMVNETTLDFSNPDEGLLKAALEELGFTVHSKAQANEYGYAFSADHFGPSYSVCVKHDGTVITNGPEVSKFDMNQVKRAYSRQVVGSAAKRLGWNVKKKNNRKMVAVRRY